MESSNFQWLQEVLGRLLVNNTKTIRTAERQLNEYIKNPESMMELWSQV